jgi:hypothetical protein
MRFELWDLTTRNVTGFFPTEAAALAAVRAAIQEHGRVYAEAFALIREDTRGRSRTIARGSDLIDRALRAADVPGRIPA